MLRWWWDRYWEWGNIHRGLNVVLAMTLTSLVLAALHQSGDMLRTAVTGVIILVTVTLWQKIWRDRSTGRHATS